MRPLKAFLGTLAIKHFGWWDNSSSCFTVDFSYLSNRLQMGPLILKARQTIRRKNLPRWDALSCFLEKVRRTSCTLNPLRLPFLKAESYGMDRRSFCDTHIHSLQTLKFNSDLLAFVLFHCKVCTYNLFCQNSRVFIKSLSHSRTNEQLYFCLHRNSNLFSQARERKARIRE